MKSFNHLVYEIVKKAPKGYVLSYGQVAALAGSPRASRAVGSAMRNAPEVLELPCHRIVNRNGDMAPDYAFGGAEAQRELLEEEGVFFRWDGRVDMEKSQFRGEL